MSLDISYLLKNLTLEEKAGLCSGEGNWWTKAVDRLGLGSIMMSDGPNGLRKQEDESTSDNLGINKSVEAVCFPTGSAMAATFNKELMYELGNHLGQAARAEGLHTLLGPAINIKRSPLCGRNFEYLSEDPCLAGELAASYTKGVQENGVGVCVKHFAVNNQEFHRMTTDAVVSERALREIYLAAFETVVKKAGPWSFMCAYNRLNGTYCCENEWLLSQVLRKEWGFDGIVMTDWGAMNDRVRALKAGLELEMPSSHGVRDQLIVQAVKEGKLAQEELDWSVKLLLEWISKAAEGKKGSYDKEEQHRFAKEAAKEGAVLLKNQGKLLPLKKGAEVAFIGTFAANPHYQGGGSSHVESYRVTNALESSQGFAKISYAPGWKEDGITGDGDLLEEAVKLARKAEVAVVFAGLPDSCESEGFDRKDMELPECQNRLIARILKEQPNTAVALCTGSPVAMPWVEDAPAVIELYFAGEACGEAAAELLFGDGSPSGHLAETFALRLEDTPCFTCFPGDGKSVVYAEDVFVGYRWYDTRKMKVLFPFGHGLTYSDFVLEGMKVSRTEFDGSGEIEVSVVLKNSGDRGAAQVVQLYVAPPKGSVQRPVHELKGFEKAYLEPGESKELKFVLDSRSFSYFEQRIGGWYFESGDYRIQLGFSSADIRETVTVKLESKPLPLVIDDVLTIEELIDAKGIGILGPFGERLKGTFGLDGQAPEGDGVLKGEAAINMVMELPLHSIASFVQLPPGMLEGMLAKLKE